MAYADDVATFKEHFMAGNGTFDSEVVHHEFASGLHGRKLDFDAIEDGSPLFQEWLDIVTATLQEFYSQERLKNVVLVSVANGTNRVVPAVAQALGNGATFLLTEKATPKSCKLTAEASAKMPKLKDHFFIVLEDAGTTGTTSATVVEDLRGHDGHDIEIINSWQRRERLEKLEAIDATYHSIIKENLPTYNREECQTNGLCAAGSQLIEHAK